MVYVIDINGQPLMPTERHGNVRRMLKSGQAKVVRRCPFTIQLLYESTTHTQPVALGIKAGSKTLGVSATTDHKVLYEAEISLRTDIVDLLSTRRETRRARRGRKTRYRKPRFDNRVHAKRKGWLAPSVKHKVDTHLTVVRKIHEFLPVTSITAEVAAFDLQKLKADLAGLARPEGTDYQQGEQYGFWNVREYVLFRDGHTCQCCKGKSKDKVLNVHHIESRKTGGDAPNNLVTLCETCHRGYHSGTVKLPDKIKRGASFKDATFMGIMRWAFYNRLRELYPDVRLTYGYLTKNTRISHNMEKTLYIDARCVSGHPDAVSDGTVYIQKKVRCHNRQIYKMSIGKGGVRKRNQLPYQVKGFQLYDRVTARGEEWYIHGRRAKGSFVLKMLDRGDPHKTLEITPTKIRLIGRQHGMICKRTVIQPGLQHSSPD